MKCTREELKQMDKRSRKLMTMQKALHSKGVIDKLYLSKTEGGRGLSSIEGRVDTSIQRVEDYIEKRRGRLIAATRSNTKDTRAS